MAQNVRDERSLGDLFSELARESSTLVRQEVQLAKAELKQSATEAAKGITFLVAGGLIAYAGLLVLLAAVVVGLWQLGVEGWFAPLIVGLVVVAIGAILMVAARNTLQGTNLAPQKTIESLKEDKEWVQDQVR
jgi:xanthine/uracil permease